MARNEEKQQGRLNRLWLQKEREEGRIKDAHAPRPKLSTLNSTSSVKKWIPSIKSEIEYYLQQSQLAHYPERKIAEFQLRIEELEREYKRFVAKLRALDPTCKHKAWTPRAYCKRRADPRDSPPSTSKKQRWDWLEDNGGVERDPANRNECATSSSSERQEHVSQPEAIPERSEPLCVNQDLPLAFHPARLAVAVAGFRGPVTHSGVSHVAHPLTRALHCGLPNLSGSLIQGRSLPTTAQTPGGAARGSAYRPALVVDQRMACLGSGAQTMESSLETMGDVGGRAERTGRGLLGLGCYSSSEEEESNA